MGVMKWYMQMSVTVESVGDSEGQSQSQLAVTAWHYVGGPPSRRSLRLFWCETKQRAWTWDLRRDRKWGRKGRSERSQRSSWKRNPERGVGKGMQRGWVGKERRRETVENGAEGTNQDELAVLSRQRSAEGSSEGRPVKMSWHFW